MIVPEQSAVAPEASAVSLAAYARHIHACECAFYGVVGGPDCELTGGCNSIWTKEERDWVAYYLAEAQQEIEAVLGYFVGRRWVTDEEHEYASRIITRWGYVVSGGVQTETTLASGETVDHSTDPAVIGPVACTVTNLTELHLYHEGTDLEIMPSVITATGTQVTFYVPRCRLVLPSKADNPSQGLQYSDLANFASKVDIKRIYNVDNYPARLVYQTCTDATNCTETEQNACIYIHNGKVGVVEARPESGSLSDWCYAQRVRLNYYAGKQMVDENGYLTRWGRQAQDAIIRLAHAKMPHEPCACDAATGMWKRDREVIVDGFGRPRRGESPFGPEEGAWAAYTFCTGPGMRLVRGGIL